MRSLAPVCLLLSLFASRADAQFRVGDPAPGENYHVELGLMLWKPEPGIVIASDSLSVVNEAGVDFVQEFGIAKKQFKEFRGALKGGKNKLRFSHVTMDYAEAARLQRTITFGGRTFNVNADATADLQWELWRVGLEHDFVAADRGLFGIIAEVNFNHVIADLRATDAFTTVTSLTDEKVPIPAIGFIARVYPHKYVSLTAEFTGFKMPGFIASRISDNDKADAHLKDFDVYATVSITRYIGLQGGYRSLTADYLLDADSADLEMKGVYFGGMVRF